MGRGKTILKYYVKKRSHPGQENSRTPVILFWYTKLNTHDAIYVCHRLAMSCVVDRFAANARCHACRQWERFDAVLGHVGTRARLHYSNWKLTVFCLYIESLTRLVRESSSSTLAVYCMYTRRRAVAYWLVPSVQVTARYMHAICHTIRTSRRSTSGPHHSFLVRCIASSSLRRRGDE